MTSFDSVVEGSFPAVGVSSVVSGGKGQRVQCLLAGTFSATVLLERSRSLAAWEVVAALSAGVNDAAASGKGYYYRLRCSAYTSGEVSYQLRIFEETQVQEDQWNDLRFPAAGVNPPGAASDPARDTTDGCLNFSASATNIIAMQTVMPHSWKTGSFVEPHIHWTKTDGGAGDVVWEFKYSIADPNGVFPAFTTITSAATVLGTPDTNTADKHLVTSFGFIPFVCAGTAPATKMLLSRLGADAGDTYAAVAKLVEFDIHILKDSLGSGGQYVK